MFSRRSSKSNDEVNKKETEKRKNSAVVKEKTRTRLGRIDLLWSSVIVQLEAPARSLSARELFLTKLLQTCEAITSLSSLKETWASARVRTTNKLHATAIVRLQELAYM